jgi:hypothetical protein
VEYKHIILPLINPLNAELNPIYHLLALLGAHHILHVSRMRVKQFKYPRPQCVKMCGYSVFFDTSL